MSVKDRPPKLCSMCHERMTVKNSTYCQECRTIYYKEWYKKHRAQMHQYQQDYRAMLKSDEKKPKKVDRGYQHRYWEEHKEHIKELQKARSEKHKRYYRPEKKSLWELEDEERWKTLKV